MSKSKRHVDTVFLIDDSEIDLFIQKRFLEVCEFSENLVMFRSADEAFTSLRGATAKEAPDVIFLDLNMPESDGFYFLENFMKLSPPVLDKSKIVVLSSSESSKDRDYAFSFPNVIHFIPKPLKQSDIEDLKKVFTV
jgi:two-component system, NarL family, nitrate/nitrite response regulator NarL